MGKSNVDESCEHACRLIDELGAPERISKRQWVEFLSAVIGECESRREAAEQELELEEA